MTIRLAWSPCVLPLLLLFAPQGSPPDYPNHQELLVYRTAAGEFQPVTTPDQWQLRRKHILEGMQQAMGPLPAVKKWPADFDAQETSTFKGDGFQRLTILLVAEHTSEGHDRIPCDLYLPAGLEAGERRPALLALHPTGPLGKRIVAGDGPRENRQYAVELAQRGYIVLAPDYPSFGDYEYDFATDDYSSGTMKGITNHIRCLDYLCARDDVDAERLGVIGHSLGGHNAMFVGAFDDRLKVVVSSCGWTPFHHYYRGDLRGWTSERYMPLINTKYNSHPDQVPFDFYEVAAALAPRAFLSCSPISDTNFAASGVKRAIPEIAKVYAIHRATDKIQVLYPNCGHDFPPDVRRQAYEFIDKHLNYQPRQDVPLPREKS